MPPARAASPSSSQGSALWHPFADMAKLGEAGVTLVRGEGSWVEDDRGRRYLDATAGLWYCNIGHGRAELASVAAEQMVELACYQIFDVFSNPPALELAARVAGLSPTGDQSAVFFTNGGSDAVDTAAKVARRYWTLQGAPERELIVARGGAYHGMNAYGTSLSGIEANASGWGRLVEGVVHVPRDDVHALERVLDENAGRVAAYIGEPVQGAAGVYPPTEGYWEEIEALCRDAGVLIVADEVVCGFGRLGRWFGSERFELQPDIVVAAKGLSSGYAPIGAVIVSEQVRDVLWQGGPFRHGYTYSGHPVSCAVALANLDIIEREGLVERVAAMEPILRAALEPLHEHEAISEVRSCGLLAGIELAGSFRRQVGGIARIVSEARDRGVLVRALDHHTLQLSPPFVITEEEIELLVARLTETIEATAVAPAA